MMCTYTADLGVAATLVNTLDKRHTTTGSPYWMAPELLSLADYSQEVCVCLQYLLIYNMCVCVCMVCVCVSIYVYKKLCVCVSVCECV